MKILKHKISPIKMSFCLLFIIMGLLSALSINIELPRYVCEDTEGSSMAMGSMDIGNTMKGIADSHNQTVTQLEKSIRNKAIYMTIINAISACLCFMDMVVDYKRKAVNI